MKKEKYNIQGMTCSSCQAHVEKAVSKLDGVKSVNVNLLSNSMIVEFDESILDNDKIISAVKDAGYGACQIEKKNLKKQYDIVKNEDMIKSMKKRLIISICFWIPLMYVAMHHMLYDWLKIPIPVFIKSLFHGKENPMKFAFCQALLVMPILFANKNYFILGFKRLFKRSPNMDSLIAIGSSAAIIYGIYAMFMINYGLEYNQTSIIEKFSRDLYFESAGTILTLVTVGKYLETKSKGKTSDAISKLINLAPKTATIIKDNIETQILTDDIKIGDIIIIKPGNSIPVDGIIIEGASSVDQSVITGESIPVYKKEGDNIISGTVNKNGTFKMKAERVGENTTLSQIIKLVEEAGTSKAPIARLADKVSGIFVPIVIVIAIISAIIWLLIRSNF